MRMRLFNLPNLLTCGNLLCGCLATFCVLKHEDVMACACFVILGAVFDFFDGMTARALGISGPIGKELDSLADVVTFGVAPSAVAWHLLLASDAGEWPSLVAFLMAAFSALRLAKFNCDERQTSSFIGLPTPANALFWVSLPSAAGLLSHGDGHLPPWLTGVLLAVMSLMLVCELPMFSLKFKRGHMGWRDLGLQYTFLALSAVLIALCALGGQPLGSLAAIVVLYVLMSVVQYLLNRSKN